MTHSPNPILALRVLAPRGTPAWGLVGLCRPSRAPGAAEADLEQHISDCSTRWQQAYQRFQQHGNPADRDEAVLWLHEQNQAVMQRPGVASVFLGRSARPSSLHAGADQ